MTDRFCLAVKLVPALLYAARNLPKDHSLLLVHGTRLTWMRGNLVESDSDEDELRELENHYEELCTKAGRDCYFKHIGYGSTTNFGDQICRVCACITSNCFRTC